ncbi:MAG: amidohydrolase [Spirosomaceae bacterium]|nr:amidohydrolase [Spirosomataceae bacterium]
MKKILLSLAALITLFLLYYCFVADFDASNDTIYFGGDIITMKDSAQVVEAVYVQNGKIIKTGSKEEIVKLQHTTTQLIDLKGKTLMPGFFDPHGHFDLATVFYDMVDISGILYRDKSAVWKIIEEKSRQGKKDEWVFFYGFDPILTKGIETPTLAYLDSIAADKPIVIITKALHVFYLNSKAFEVLGITNKTPDPSAASYYEKDKNGNLTGAIIEQEALEPLRLKMVELSKSSFLKNTEAVFEQNAKLGITSNVIMGMSATSPPILSLYEHLCSEKSKPFFKLLQLIGKLPERKPNSRLFLYLKKDFDQFLPEKIENGNDFFKIMGIKLWYDGSPYSGSMFLEQPYIESKFTIEDIHLAVGHTSSSLITPTELPNIIEKYQDQGWQVAIHSQGDIAGKEVIEAFEKVNAKRSTQAFRHRLEHGMLLPVSMIQPMKKMNISASFHINHLLFYGEFLKEQILGGLRGEQIFPVKSYADTGVPFSLHADMPQFVPNPFSLMSTAVNRTTESGLLITPVERISVWQALKSMTINAAWQLHMEDKLGSIEKGKYADFVILDKNPLKTQPENLSKIQVLETIVAGNTVWKK